MNIKKTILETLIDMTIAILWSMLIYYLTNTGMGAIGFYIFLNCCYSKNKFKGE